MQVAIDAADRKLLIVAGTLFFLLLGAVAFFTPSEQGEGAMPSTYSSAPAGARATYLLLEDLHYDVRRWESPPTELPSGVSNVVLIIADPFATPDSHEHAANLVTHRRRDLAGKGETDVPSIDAHRSIGIRGTDAPVVAVKPAPCFLCG